MTLTVPLAEALNLKFKAIAYLDPPDVLGFDLFLCNDDVCSHACREQMVDGAVVGGIHPALGKLYLSLSTQSFGKTHHSTRPLRLSFTSLLYKVYFFTYIPCFSTLYEFLLAKYWHLVLFFRFSMTHYGPKLGFMVDSINGLKSEWANGTLRYWRIFFGNDTALKLGK